MNKKADFALVPRPPSALEKIQQGAKRILSGMIADTLALTKKEQATKSRPLRIIQVNDEAGVSGGFAFLIRSWLPDATLLSFSSAADALEELSQTEPDLLITDDTMPGMRGSELCQRLLDRKVTYPIVVNSAWEPTENWVRELASRGLNVFFLSLPYSLESLRKVLEAAGLQIPRGVTDPDKVRSQPHKTRPPRIVRMAVAQITQESLNDLNKLPLKMRQIAFDLMSNLQDQGLINPTLMWKASKIVPGSRNPLVMQGTQKEDPPRVLILDDEEGPRKATSFILKGWYEKIEVVEFDNGDSAWLALAKSNFDIFITDVRHPGVSCQEMFARLSKLKATCQILVMSAGVSLNDNGKWVWGEAQVQSWGPNLKITCLPKPVSLDDFRIAVESALQIPARKQS